MKKLTSIIIVLVLLVSMFTVATCAQTVPLAASNDSEYLISEFTKENADKVSGAIHGYMGDCDGDADISIMDATEIQLAVAQLITLDEIHSMLADADCDGDASIMDATEIQLYVAQLSTSDVIGHILYTPVVEFDPEKYAYVKVDDEYYLVTGEDKTFTYTAYLASDAKISSLDARVMYDSSGIEFLPDIDEDGYYTDYEYPNLKNPVYTDIGGQINYNFSYYKGINFPVPEYDDMDYDNILFTGQFKVTADTGVYEISHIIKVLGGAPNYKIIWNYEKVNDEVTVITDNELTGLYLIDNSLIPTEPVPTEAPEPTEERPTEYYPDYPTNAVIHFDANTTSWNNYKYIGFHIWTYGEDSFYAWSSKAQRGTDKDGDGIWTYDLNAKDVYLEPGTLYGVIFYTDTGMQTHDLLFDSSVIGDTAYVNPDIMYENIADSSKSSVAAFWQGQDPTVFGPVMGVTSIGNVVGTCIPSTTSAGEMFEDFLENTLENARTYSGKDDQQLLDDTAKALGLDKSNVQDAINNTRVDVDWKAQYSTLSGGTNSEPSVPGTITRTDAFDEIKSYLVRYGDEYNSIHFEDWETYYNVTIAYNSDYNAIEIYGYDYSSPRTIDTYIRINRGDYVFYYTSEMSASVSDVSSSIYYSATGFASIKSPNPVSFYTEKSTFSSTAYASYSDAEPTITAGFAKALATSDYALWGNVTCSIYDLL